MCLTACLYERLCEENNFDCGIQCKCVGAIYALRILVSSQPFAIEICNSGLLVHTRAGLACCGLLSRVAAKAVCLGSRLMGVVLVKESDCAPNSEDNSL